MRRLADDRKMQIGFPGARDFDYGHTKHLEREVVGFFADLFRAPGDDRWGYVTSGGTESNLYALYLARSLFSDGLVYYSDAAHYSIPKAVDVLGMQAVRVRTTAAGVVDYGGLRNVIGQHRDRSAIVVANIGTTMTEAVDDVGRIKTVLRELSIGRHFIHSDAALSGIPLALLDIRPRFDLADGADSIAISGHKFIGMPFPCGVVVTRRSLMRRLSQPVAYTGSTDATLGGSRSGHAALFLWYAIRQHGLAAGDSARSTPADWPSTRAGGLSNWAGRRGAIHPRSRSSSRPRRVAWPGGGCSPPMTTDGVTSSVCRA